MRKITLFSLVLLSLCFLSCSMGNASPKQQLDDPDNIAYQDYFVTKHPDSFYRHLERVKSVTDRTKIEGTGIIGTWVDHYEDEDRWYYDCFIFSKDGTFTNVYENNEGYYEKDTCRYSLKKDKDGHFQVITIKENGNNQRKDVYYYMILDNILYW